MAQEIINIGTTPNDGTGDPLRTAFNKVNENFTELYTDDAGDVNSIEATAPIARDNATGAVTISLSDLGVTSGKLAADSVITDKILDLNVTTAKIADDAITTDKLANSINTTITDLQTDKYDKTGGTISGNATITGNLIVDTNTLYVDSSNNRVGIGTDSPSSKLEISGATGSYDSGIGFNATGTGARVYRTFIDTSGTFRFDDVSAGFLTRLAISTSGNVGIGTTSPNAKLKIEGDGFTNGLSIKSAGNSGTYPFMVTYASGTEGDAFCIDDNLNVGIGTTSPNNKLTVSGDGGGSAISYFNNTNSSGYGILINTPDANNARYALRVNTGAGTVFNVGNGGNVGIGTTSPSTELHVKAPSGYAELRLQGASGSGSTVEFYDDTTKLGDIYIDPSKNIVFRNASESMKITSGGNVGIDVLSPQERLDVGGVMRAFGYESRSGTNGITQYTGSFFNIFWTGSSAQLYIDTASVGTITLTSDYRVKKNIETQNASAIERINALRPVKYEYADYENIFVADNIQREGFIAHEVAQIIPSAVEGEKDAENAFQSLKLDAMLSVAVKAIQEQQEIINELKARIETLENQ